MVLQRPVSSHVGGWQGENPETLLDSAAHSRLAAFVLTGSYTLPKAVCFFAPTPSSAQIQSPTNRETNGQVALHETTSVSRGLRCFAAACFIGS